MSYKKSIILIVAVGFILFLSLMSLTCNAQIFRNENQIHIVNAIGLSGAIYAETAYVNYYNPPKAYTAFVIGSLASAAVFELYKYAHRQRRLKKITSTDYYEFRK